MIILTHRGLEPSSNEAYLESSKESFERHLKRGFGIEFDIVFEELKKIIVVSHGQVQDDSLSLTELLKLIKQFGSKNVIHAIHIKHSFQELKLIDLLLKSIKSANQKNFLLFDLKPETAVYIRSKNKEIHLALSISHPFDKERYNNFVGGTLNTIDTALRYKDIIDWVWLDEWDLLDKDGSEKTLYNQNTFNIIRANGLKIALVTPELHATSPNLLANEKHQDAESLQKLFRRIEKILKLQPDAVCTDYPEEIKNLCLKH